METASRSPEQLTKTALRRKVETGLVYAGAVGMGVGLGSITSDTLRETTSYTESSPVQTELDVHILQFESDSSSNYIQIAKVEAAIDYVGSMLEQQTEGRYDLSPVADITIEIKPDGLLDHDKKSVTTPKDCYDRDTINNVFTGYIQKHNLDSSNAIYGVLDDAVLCSGDAGVNYTIDRDRGVAKVAVNGSYATGLGIIAHEYGHSWGLYHQGVIGCEDKPDNAAYYKIRSIAEIVRDCGRVKLSGKPNAYNEYASKNSSMGGVEKPADSLYSLPEFNQLTAEGYPVTEVLPEPGKYYLSTEFGQQHGIAINLPKEHVLRQLDSTLNQLVIGEDTFSNYGYVQYVKVFATGSARSYVVRSTDTQFISVPVWGPTLPQEELDKTGEDLADKLNKSETIVYVDEKLGGGIAVTVGRERDTGQVYLQISSLDTAYIQHKLETYVAK